jgi:hypothetical protein
VGRLTIRVALMCFWSLFLPGIAVGQAAGATVQEEFPAFDAAFFRSVCVEERLTKSTLLAYVERHWGDALDVKGSKIGEIMVWQVIVKPGKPTQLPAVTSLTFAAETEEAPVFSVEMIGFGHGERVKSAVAALPRARMDKPVKSELSVDSYGSQGQIGGRHPKALALNWQTGVSPQFGVSTHSYTLSCKPAQGQRN